MTVYPKTAMCAPSIVLLLQHRQAPDWTAHILSVTRPGRQDRQGACSGRHQPCTHIAALALRASAACLYSSLKQAYNRGKAASSIAGHTGPSGCPGRHPHRRWTRRLGHRGPLHTAAEPVALPRCLPPTGRSPANATQSGKHSRSYGAHKLENQAHGWRVSVNIAEAETSRAVQIACCALQETSLLLSI